VNAVNATSVNGYTPLYRAISEGNNNIAKLLIEKGANVNAMNKKGITPLHYAIYSKNFKTVEFLIEKKANVNLNILSYANYHGAGNEVIQLLERTRKTQEARNQDQNASNTPVGEELSIEEGFYKKQNQEQNLG
jgi:ankyrin repeat protein